MSKATTIWADGAENYSATNGQTIDSLMKTAAWGDASGVAFSTNARTGIGSFFLRTLSYMRRVTNDVTGLISAESNRTIFAFNTVGLPSGVGTGSALISFNNAASNTCMALQLLPTGRLRAVNASYSEYQDSVREVSAGVWTHIEVTAVVQPDGSGAMTVRVNDDDNFTLSASFSDCTTHVTPGDDLGPNPIAEIEFNRRGLFAANFYTQQDTYYDDIATFVDGGDKVGLYGVYYLKPVSDGNYTDFSPTSGTTCYNMVNEIAPDGDSNFIYAGGADKWQSFVVEPLPSNVTDVFSVLPVSYGRKTDTGIAQLQVGVRHGGTDGLIGIGIPQAEDYGHLTYAFDTPPDGGSWSPSSLPEVIVKREA